MKNWRKDSTTDEPPDYRALGMGQIYIEIIIILAYITDLNSPTDCRDTGSVYWFNSSARIPRF